MILKLAQGESRRYFLWTLLGYGPALNDILIITYGSSAQWGWFKYCSPRMSCLGMKVDEDFQVGNQLHPNSPSKCARTVPDPTASTRSEPVDSWWLDPKRTSLGIENPSEIRWGVWTAGIAFKYPNARSGCDHRPLGASYLSMWDSTTRGHIWLIWVVRQGKTTSVRCIWAWMWYCSWQQSRMWHSPTVSLLFWDATS